MAEERLFTIPLRKEFLKAPIYKRSSKAVKAVKYFISRHMKAKDVKVGEELNLLLWSRGRKNPPSKVKVKSMIVDGVAFVDVPEAVLTNINEKMPEEPVVDKLLPVNVEEAKATKVSEDKEKEIIKELKKEEEIKQKVEHAGEVVDKPSKSLKQNVKIKERTEKHSKVIPQSGRKDSHEPKP